MFHFARVCQNFCKSSNPLRVRSATRLRDTPSVQGNFNQTNTGWSSSNHGKILVYTLNQQVDAAATSEPKMDGKRDGDKNGIGLLDVVASNSDGVWNV